MRETKDRNKRGQVSIKTRQVLSERARAIHEKHSEESERLPAAFKNREEGRRKIVFEAVVKELDARDRWLGSRELKSTSNPTPYHNKDQEGNRITPRRQSTACSKTFQPTAMAKTMRRTQKTGRQM